MESEVAGSSESPDSLAIRLTALIFELDSPESSEVVVQLVNERRKRLPVASHRAAFPFLSALWGRFISRFTAGLEAKGGHPSRRDKTRNLLSNDGKVYWLFFFQVPPS